MVAPSFRFTQVQMRAHGVRCQIQVFGDLRHAQTPRKLRKDGELAFAQRLCRARLAAHLGQGHGLRGLSIDVGPIGSYQSNGAR